MADDTTGHPPVPDPRNKLLDALLGRWRTQGRTLGAEADPAILIEGFDDYEWMAGGFFLVHRADVGMGDQRVEVIEMIGPYEPDSGTFPMRSFDNHGGFATMRAAVDDDGVWRFTGETERATLVIAEDGASMAARWERTEDGASWHPWMDMTFTKM
ncbi:DUF1579 family protein [Actinomadura viridis]|uniref:DUF1579 family protein n=1 Tax=Actinomadura viridis TaxID=58110 RepID=UPI00369085E8